MDESAIKDREDFVKREEKRLLDMQSHLNQEEIRVKNLLDIWGKSVSDLKREKAELSQSVERLMGGLSAVKTEKLQLESEVAGILKDLEGLKKRHGDAVAELHRMASEGSKMMEEAWRKSAEAERAFKEAASLKADANKLMSQASEHADAVAVKERELIALHSDLQDQRRSFDEECKAFASFKTSEVASMDLAKNEIAAEKVAAGHALRIAKDTLKEAESASLKAADWSKSLQGQEASLKSLERDLKIREEKLILAEAQNKFNADANNRRAEELRLKDISLQVRDKQVIEREKAVNILKEAVRLGIPT